MFVMVWHSMISVLGQGEFRFLEGKWEKNGMGHMIQTLKIGTWRVYHPIDNIKIQHHLAKLYDSFWELGGDNVRESARE